MGLLHCRCIWLLLFEDAMSGVRLRRNKDIIFCKILKNIESFIRILL